MKSRGHIKQRWQTFQKLRFVAESWHLEGQSLGAYLRSNGIHSTDIETWRIMMAAGLDENKPLLREERSQYEKRIKSLEAELAQANAILAIQKKSELIVHGEERSTLESNEINCANSSEKENKKG